MKVILTTIILFFSLSTFAQTFSCSLPDFHIVYFELSDKPERIPKFHIRFEFQTDSTYQIKFKRNSCKGLRSGINTEFKMSAPNCKEKQLSKFEKKVIGFIPSINSKELKSDSIYLYGKGKMILVREYL